MQRDIWEARGLTKSIRVAAKRQDKAFVREIRVDYSDITAVQTRYAPRSAKSAKYVKAGKIAFESVWLYASMKSRRMFTARTRDLYLSRHVV